MAKNPKLIELPPVDETPAYSNGAAAPNPFNAAALRLPPSFEQTAGVKKMITTVPVRKPNRQEWIRVHPGEDYRGDFATIHLKQDSEYYLVVPAMIESLRNELTLITIYTAINRAGVVFLWPAPRPSSEGRAGAKLRPRVFMVMDARRRAGREHQRASRMRRNDQPDGLPLRWSTPLVCLSGLLQRSLLRAPSRHPLRRW
jgi:hypothetical protein